MCAAACVIALPQSSEALKLECAFIDDEGLIPRTASLHLTHRSSRFSLPRSLFAGEFSFNFDYSHLMLNFSFNSDFYTTSTD